MRDAAYCGLAGDIVKAIEPYTEADPAGILLTLLAAFGAAVGPGPHAVADGSIHPARLNIVLVGATSRARKGTSWSVVRNLFDGADRDFVAGRVIGGLASGEGLVADLAGRGRTCGADVDPVDRSVLVVEPELGRLLRVAARSATLSAIIREAWDGGDLKILTRRQPLRATDVNVSVVGHVTIEELRRRLDDVEVANGFGNRFLWIWVKRSKRLASGSGIPTAELDQLAGQLRTAIDRARGLSRLTWSPAARTRWVELYDALDDNVTGVLGALTARAEPQLLRLCVAFAAMDGSVTIEPDHLEAAEAVWGHSVTTVARIFADHQTDHVARRLLLALNRAGPQGLDGSQQRDLFHRHLGGHRLAEARSALERSGLVRTTMEPTSGRPRLVTWPVGPGAPAEDETRGLWSLPSPSDAAASSQSWDVEP